MKFFKAVGVKNVIINSGGFSETGPEGEALKVFSMRDGHGLWLVREAGIEVVTGTARFADAQQIVAPPRPAEERGGAPESPGKSYPWRRESGTRAI